MVAGFLGGFLTGIFTTVFVCAAFSLTNPGGAIEGNGRQVWLQIVVAIFIIGLNFFITTIISVFIKSVLRIPLRLNEPQLPVNNDAVHGEEAYTLFFDGERSHISLHRTGFESGHIIDTNLGSKEESGQESPGKLSGSKMTTEVQVHSFSA